MSDSGIDDKQLFHVAAEVRISATPHEVYAVISDLPRSGEWSAECVGGTWVSGDPATAGAVFRGENLRREETVSWAPVVRGSWSTEAEVVAAEPGHEFSWAMRSEAGSKQESIWSFLLSGSGGSCALVHRFWMGEATEGIRRITGDMNAAEKDRFLVEWGEKLRREIAETVQRIKRVIEGS